MEGGEEAGEVMGGEERAKTKMISDVLGFGSGGRKLRRGLDVSPAPDFSGAVGISAGEI